MAPTVKESPRETMRALGRPSSLGRGLANASARGAFSAAGMDNRAAKNAAKRTGGLMGGFLHKPLRQTWSNNQVLGRTFKPDVNFVEASALAS